MKLRTVDTEINASFSIVYLRAGSTFGTGASGGRSFVGGNHPNSLVTEEGLTIVVVRGSICDQTVS